MTVDERVENNLALVRSCVKRFLQKGIDFEELYAAGCLGLVKAAKGFDEERGFLFSTYAVPVILGEIKRLFRDGGSIKASRSLKELSLKAKKIADEYQKENGETIKVSTLSIQLGIDEFTAAEALSLSLSPLSLSPDDENAPPEIPVDSGEEEITDRLSLEEAMKQLSKEEKELITLRYFGEKTQSQTAKALGTTQVQISRKEKKILLKMRALLV